MTPDPPATPVGADLVVQPSRTLERVLLVAHSMRMLAALMISLRLVTTPARCAHAVVIGGR